MKHSKSIKFETNKLIIIYKLIFICFHCISLQKYVEKRFPVCSNKAQKFGKKLEYVEKNIEHTEYWFYFFINT